MRTPKPKQTASEKFFVHHAGDWLPVAGKVNESGCLEYQLPGDKRKHHAAAGQFTTERPVASHERIV